MNLQISTLNNLNDIDYIKTILNSIKIYKTIQKTYRMHKIYTTFQRKIKDVNKCGDIPCL